MSEGDTPITGIGEKLRIERELRKVDLESIASSTKISIHLLRAIEEDRWDDLPGGIFTRNFIRLYSKELGLNPEKWVNEYLAQSRERELTDGKEPEHVASHSDKKKETSNSWLYGLFIVAIILLISGFLAISYLGGEDTPANDSPVQEEPVEEPEGRVTGERESTIVRDENVDQELVIEIMDTQREVWLMWWVDDLHSEDQNRTMAINEPLRISAAKSIKIRIGHLEGVTLTVNGESRNWREFPQKKVLNDEGNAIAVDVEFTRLAANPNAQ